MRNLLQRIGIAGLAPLAAALALGAIAAGSAAALPEFGKCVAKAEGKYTESNCATKAKTGQPHIFERVKAKEIVKSHFTATSADWMFFEGESGVEIACSGSTATGELNKKGTTQAAKGVRNVVWTYKGCEIPSLFSSFCQSKGAAPQEIVTNNLEGNLVYANKANKEVLQELHPKLKKGAFAEFDCGIGRESSVTVVVKEKPESEGGKGGHNCIFSEATPTDVMSTTGKSIFTAKGNETGEQVPQTDEKLKPAKCNLEEEVSGDEPEWDSINDEATIKWEEAIEIFA